jgi:undecaprenyl-diphosphatase
MTEPPSAPFSARAILEQNLAQVQSSQVAKSIMQRVLELTGDDSEAERTERAHQESAGSLKLMTGVSEPLSVDRVATILVATAMRSLAGGDDAKQIAGVAYDLFAPSEPDAPEATQLGAELLRSAVLESLHMPEVLDARVFLAIRRTPHPKAIRVLCEVVGKCAMLGGFWAVGVLFAYRLGIKRSDRALKLLVPTVSLAAWICEKPAKKYFARRRSFRHLVAMMVLGLKPRVESFPSGHAATSYAGAWILSTVWPDWRPGFLAIASLISLTRVYLGLHDPDEVLAGGVLGVILAELLRRPTEWLVEHAHLP